MAKSGVGYEGEENSQEAFRVMMMMREQIEICMGIYR